MLYLWAACAHGQLPKRRAVWCCSALQRWVNLAGNCAGDRAAAAHDIKTTPPAGGMGSAAAGVEFLRHSVGASPADCWDSHTLSGLRDISCPEPGVITCELSVGPLVQNRYKTLHGGCVASIVDVVGTAAILTRSKKGGVSVSINVTYHSPAPGGQAVRISATAVRVGRTLATAEVDVRLASTGELVGRGTHVKFMSPNEPEITAYLPGGAAAAGGAGASWRPGARGEAAPPELPRSRL